MNNRHHAWKVLSLMLLLVITTALCACKQGDGNSPPHTLDSSPASVTLAPVPDEPPASNADTTPDEPLTSQQQFVPGTLAPETGHYIIASATTDQFGDNEQYTICLYSSEKPDKDLGFEVYGDIYLGIYGSEKHDEVILTDDGDIGKPNMFVGDFTGDGLVEVFIEIPISSADGLAPTLGFIYSFDGKLRRIFDNGDMNPFAYSITFEDNYKITVHSGVTGRLYIGDLYFAYSSDPLIYDATGKAAPGIQNYNEAYLHDFTVVNNVIIDDVCDSTYYLCINEELFNLDINICVGDIVSYLKWDSTYEKFIIAKQYYVPAEDTYYDQGHN